MRFSTAFRTAAVLVVLMLAVSLMLDWNPDSTMYNRNVDRDGSGTVPGIDSDGDGLRDTDEDLNRNDRVDPSESSPTDPFDRDTDGDGWEDGDEFSYYQERATNISSVPNWMLRFPGDDPSLVSLMGYLSPNGDPDGDGLVNMLDADSDNDGILDGDEIEGGTDPLDPDSDGDTIPDLPDKLHGITRDTDGDMMDDSWESYHGVSDPEGDPDGDGLDNLEEYELSKDPGHTDSLSYNPGDIDPLSLLDIGSPDDIHFRTQGIGPRYLRSISLDRYDGNEWSRGPLLLDEIPSGTGLVKVNFSLNGSWMGYLPVPSDIVVPISSVPDPLHPHRGSVIPNARNDILFSGIPIRGYSVEISNNSIPLDVLASSNASGESPSRYLEVHSSIRSEVWDLSVEWDTSEESDFQRAMRIIDLLWSRCVYSSGSAMESDDPLYRFLFLTRNGNSLDFASTFTMLMRMYDIPARVVLGYALGEDRGDQRIYREGHLHAWSEVLLSDVGWVQFEVTPHSIRETGGSGIVGDGSDPNVMGPNGGDGGGTLKGSGAEELPPLDDTDGDGLINSREEELGTDPRKRDSDGDGIEDGTEIERYGTDPLDPDSDDDGLNDGEERDIGTDPMAPDTDMGGMQDGAEVNFIPDPLDPLNASDDTVLTDVDGDGLNTTMERIWGTLPGNNDTDGDGLLDGEEVFSFGTDPLDPDTDNDTISDRDEVLGIYALPTDPISPDSDGDGLGDRDEIRNGTSPSLADTDMDGLSDGEEILSYGSDPLDPDSDGDWLMDGYELDISTDPLSPDTDGDGIIDSLEKWYGFNPRSDQDSVAPPDMDGDGIRDDMEQLTNTLVGENDTDGDGLPDGMEYFMIHTDPASNDTDLDGSSDMEELLEYFTDPLANDTDGDRIRDPIEYGFGSSPRIKDADRDSISDGGEFLNGTDPADPDTDGGGIIDGIELMIGRDPLDGNDDLPFFGDRDGDGLPDILEVDLGTNLSDPDTDGDGLSDGEETSIHETSPLDVDTDEDGAGDGEEINSLFTDPLESDTDSDGIKDGNEIEDWGTDPLVNDTDSDGLLDGEEIDIGTDPKTPDSDSDGLPDGYEVNVDQDPDREGIQGLDPLREDTDRGGATDGIEIEHGGDPLDPSDDPSLTDLDGDGLLDIEEDLDGDRQADANETDLRDPDTDGDGILDSYEIWGSLGPPTDPLDPDTDNDTIPDGEEVIEGDDSYITDPTSADTDNDTLRDDDEIFGSFGYASDPTSPDGDGDSLNDTLELNVIGTDPLDPDTDGDGLPDGWVDGWRGRPKNGRMDVGEFEDRDLDGNVDTGNWNGGSGPGETDPLDPDTDGGGVSDGYEVFYRGSADPLLPWDDELIKDSDGDGLTDIEENGTGHMTDWDDPDTDGDGLADGFETVMIDGIELPGELSGHNGFQPTDPLKSDSDGDGLLDGWEVSNATDPNDVDTDGDKLWDGFTIVGNDGRVHKGELSRNNGYEPTDPLDPDTDGDGLLDGSSVTLATGKQAPGEYDYVTDPHDPDTDGDGLTDLQEVRTFYNNTKRPDNGYLNLLITSPIDPDTDDGGMSDGLEAELELDPLDPSDDDGFQDTDGDGLTNHQERVEIFFSSRDYNNVDWDGDGRPNSNPNWQDPDTDGDGLSDGEEFFNRQYELNPVSPDTDGDGLNDRMELEVYGTDPTSPDTDGDMLPDVLEIERRYNTSFVDWDLDGVIDHRTDPTNPDTDLDSIHDGEEVFDETPTNPLDPGDPGIELLPEEEPFVFIDSAPDEVTKKTDPGRGSFTVSGVVRDQRGSPVEGIGVSIILVEQGIKSDMAVDLEMNRELRVGSISATTGEGTFSVVCTPNEGSPFGDVQLFAVSRRANLDGRRYLPSASDPHSLKVLSDSILDIRKGNISLTTGDVGLVTGRLTDSGGVPAGMRDITVAPDFGEPLQLTSGEKGFFSYTFKAPVEPGENDIVFRYGGDEHLSPSQSRITVFVSPGPSIELEPIPSSNVVGDTLYINGTVTGGEALPGDILNATFILKENMRTVDIAQGPDPDPTFSFPVTLDAGVFPPGDYILSVSVGTGTDVLAVNSSLEFTIMDTTLISVPDPVVVRGIDPFLSVQLSRGNGRPLPGGTLRITVPSIPSVPEMISSTNSTGWALFEVPLSGATPLGITPMTVEHVLEDGSAVPARWEGILNIRAEAEIEVVEGPDSLVLLDSMTFEGRLRDERGTGIDGENDIEIILNGDLIGTASTRDGGWFTSTEIVPQYTRLGQGLLVIRFPGLEDERSEWYPPFQVGKRITVSSRTYLETETRFFDGNSTISVGLENERGDPVPDAPVRIGVGVNYRTYLTGPSGNITVDLGEVDQGEEIAVVYPGDPGSFLLPSNTTLIYPVQDETVNVSDTGKIVIVAFGAALVIIGLIIFSRLMKFRKDVGAIKAKKRRDSAIYPFEPVSTSQRMLVETYREALNMLKENGLARPAAMTPTEYSENMHRANNELKGLDRLTDLFNEARYSGHRISSHLISKAREARSSIESSLKSTDPDRVAKNMGRVGFNREERRDVTWRMKIDHERDLRELLGDKEVDD